MHRMQWLNDVDKPARYVGGEQNAVDKDPKGKLRVALCFPDVYEVGMSHLGLRILYQALNDLEDVYCERSYAPWLDAEKAMRDCGQPLYALETGDELAAFDILGFSLQYEMSYTNVLNMIDLAGLPLHQAERTEAHPLIVAGGPCALHAEPLAPFVDLFLLGDGEETIVALAKAVHEAKRDGVTRERLLLSLCEMDGFYVPSLYDVCYHKENGLRAVTPKQGAPARVKKAVVADLENAVYPLCPLVPNTAIIHDRAVVELFRGCTRGCRFCQAGYVYRPVRERSPKALASQARTLIDNTGYEEISLLSLSSGDYPHLSALINELNRDFKDRRVSLSLPSLRIDSYVSDYAKGTAQVRRGGLTFAPEAGTQRLRDIINKGVTEEDLLRSVHDAFLAGYSKVKLYFMLGLPMETDEDLLGIVDLAQKVVDAYYALPKENRPQPPQVTVSVSPFVPKPFTPFQWDAQPTVQELRRRQQLLRDAIRKHRRIRFATHDASLSAVEAVFARGDRRLSKALLRAYELGARMDGWSECFDFDLWARAMEESGLSIEAYANRERGVDEVLPWDHIDVGVTKAYLQRERERAKAGLTTQDCREGCTGCGLTEICEGMG